MLDSFVDAHPDLVAAHPTVTALDRRAAKPERVAAEATWLAYEANQRRLDLFHHAGGVVPPGPGIARVPAVLTIHDLQPLVHPEHFSSVKRRWLGTMLPRSARKARLVLTPSDPASQSVVDLLGLPAERVHTVPHGIEEPEPVDASAMREVGERYRLTGPSVLYPAITYPHKDHLTLIRAFARLAPEHPDLSLVLTGGPGPSEVEVAAEVRRLDVGDQVRRTGRVPWSDLDALYASAAVVAVPSRFEGFGAPALEAMARGVPLVARRATALPWVVGDGGVLVEPGDVDGWADALAQVLDDPADARRLADAGRRRAATFTWERAGAELVAGYRRALELGEDGAR